MKENIQFTSGVFIVWKKNTYQILGNLYNICITLGYLPQHTKDGFINVKLIDMITTIHGEFGRLAMPCSYRVPLF